MQSTETVLAEGASVAVSLEAPPVRIRHCITKVLRAPCTTRVLLGQSVYGDLRNPPTGTVRADRRTAGSCCGGGLEQAT